MILRNSLKLLAVSTLCIGFIGCGGGGGGSSASGGGNNSGGSKNIGFPSNAVSATPTLENGKKVKDAVSTNPLANNPALNSVAQTSNVNIGLLNSKISQIIIKKTKDINLQTYALNEVVNETDNCSDGGTINFSGNEDDANGGTVTITVNNCVENDLKLNGSIYENISNNDGNGNFKDISIKYTTDFTISSVNNALSLTIFKGSFENVNVSQYASSGAPEKFKAFTSLIASDGTQKYGVKDGTYYYTINENTGKINMYQTQGRIYIDNLASYVDYDTNYDMSKTPFVFDYSGLESGEAHYNMANNGKVKIEAENGVVKTYVDANNDGTYELHD